MHVSRRFACYVSGLGIQRLGQAPGVFPYHQFSEIQRKSVVI
jgi:hypothetical protein